MGYRDYLLGSAPAWLRDAVADTWLDALGQALDVQIQAARGAARLKMAVDSGTGEPGIDTLRAQTGERQLERGGQWTETTWLARVQAAFETWRFAGTAYGLLTALSDFGYRTAKVAIPNGLLYSLDGSGNLVATALPTGSWSTGPGNWNAYQILFVAGALPATAQGAISNWGVATPASNSDEVNSLRRIIKRWRPAHTRCLSIVAITSGGVWGYPVGQLWAVSGDTWDTTDVTVEYSV